MFLNQRSIIVPFCFLLYHLGSVAVAGDSPAVFQAVDNVAINCGSSGSSAALDGRQWIGDVGSRSSIFSSGSKGKMISSSTVDPLLSADPVPYTTARISHSEFTYTFTISPGPKFIRLHFYPSSYPGFKRSMSLFNVKAGLYTLLSNFSASLTADALGVRSFSKEFCINVQENQPLSITFSPSAAVSSGEVYAFVNGIEVVSLPADLYHTAEGDAGAYIVGQKNQLSVDYSIALETVQRLNIGGISISSAQDTGMFREWSNDSNYLLETSVSPVITTVRIRYRKTPAYIAPQKIYQTSWSMDPYRQIKKKYNFTWKLPVDMGFRYLVRFHFCELDYEMKEIGQKEFSILINNQIAEADGDLIMWGGEIGAAVYRDYVVMMEGDRMEGKRDLVISICPHGNHEFEEASEPTDAILKGLELFKLSNPDNNLAGVNPMVPSTHVPAAFSFWKLVFISSVGNSIVIGVITVLAVLYVVVYQLRFRRGNPGSRNISPAGSEELCRIFSLTKVRAATNNFHGMVIGSDKFGTTYKGCIDNGASPVAIKRMNSQTRQRAEEFRTEIEILSKLRHKHLIKLIGYCDEGQEMILVFEHMVRGSLADHIYKNRENSDGDVPPLSWEQRLDICLHAARGLDYLHTGTQHGIIHRDVRSTSIMLDENYIAKIADFRLCKTSTTNDTFTHISTDIKGTTGYLDPEYFFTRWLTKKSDVYAFGVVLWEVLCGRRAVESRVTEQRNLAQWAQRCYKEGKVDDIIDSAVRGQISLACQNVFTAVANKCLHNTPTERPTMADVVACLERAVELQRRGGDVAEGEVDELTNPTGAGSEQLMLSNNKRAVLCQFLNLDNNGPYTLEELFPLLERYKVFADFIPDRGTLMRFGGRVRATLHMFEMDITSGVVPRLAADGGIHPLTKDVLNYMKTLSQYNETINLLLKDPEADGEDSFTDENNSSASFSSGLLPTALHFQSLVSSLESTLEDIAKSYKDNSLRHIFLMNNIHYMAEEVKGGPELITILGDEWVRIHTWKMRKQEMDYERATWNSVLNFLRDIGSSKSNSNHATRNHLKERLRSFYLAFEDVYKSQTAWFVPDLQLREELRISVSAKLIQAYRPCVKKCEDHQCERYIKYTADDVENYLADLFEGSPKGLGNRYRK